MVRLLIDSRALMNMEVNVLVVRRQLMLDMLWVTNMQRNKSPRVVLCNILVSVVCDTRLSLCVIAFEGTQYVIFNRSVF